MSSCINHYQTWKLCEQFVWLVPSSVSHLAMVPCRDKTRGTYQELSGNFRIPREGLFSRFKPHPRSFVRGARLDRASPGILVTIFFLRSFDRLSHQVRCYVDYIRLYCIIYHLY
jgi:hypothetical protein